MELFRPLQLYLPGASLSAREGDRYIPIQESTNAGPNAKFDGAFKPTADLGTAAVAGNGTEPVAAAVAHARRPAAEKKTDRLLCTATRLGGKYVSLASDNFVEVAPSAYNYTCGMQACTRSQILACMQHTSKGAARGLLGDFLPGSRAGC